jgi:hypothetical protein
VTAQLALFQKSDVRAHLLATKFMVIKTAAARIGTAAPRNNKIHPCSIFPLKLLSKPQLF